MLCLVELTLPDPLEFLVELLLLHAAELFDCLLVCIVCPVEKHLYSKLGAAAVEANAADNIKHAVELDDLEFPVRECDVEDILAIFLLHAHSPLLKGLFRALPVLAVHLPVDIEEVGNATQGGNMGQLPVGRIQAAGKVPAGYRCRDIPVSLKTVEVWVQVYDRVGS